MSAGVGTPLERVLAQPLIMGLFLPLQSGAWNTTTLARGTDWRFPYNAQCTIRAEELGFDLVFGLAQWLGKNGYGGEMAFREYAMDPLMVTAGLSSVTKRILLISTVHVLYGWHPLQLAKLGATLDQMSGGRWGINVVTGYKPSELNMFGLPAIEHDQRYEIAEEFVMLMERLWREPENLSYDGKFWSLEEAYVSPKPLARKCIMVSAGSSPAGIAYAARHTDLMFITSPAGAEPSDALASLPEHTANIKAAGRALGRDLKLIIHPMVLCRDTESEARKLADQIIEHTDKVATDNFLRPFEQGDQSSWKGFKRDSAVLGGNVNLVGTPSQVVDWFIAAKAAGCDGVQISFFDFLPDLEHFGNKVLPMMIEAGLREKIEA